MENRRTNSVSYGPWLVGLGAALWGTESAWRIPLNALFDADVIVFWEHVLILFMFLPLLISRVSEIGKIDVSTWVYLFFSGFAGSAVGTIFFTLALKYGNPTVVNVVLNIQPVISTMGAFLLFGDRLGPRFFLYAGIAILAGIFVSVTHPTLIATSFERAGLNRGTGYALICALFWGLATVAGRGVMTDMSLRLASSLRIVVGLACMTLILLGYLAGFARLHFRWYTPPHLFRRVTPYACIDGGLLRDDADPRRGVYHVGLLPRNARTTSGGFGADADRSRSHGASCPAKGRTKNWLRAVG